MSGTPCKALRTLFVDKRYINVLFNAPTNRPVSVPAMAAFPAILPSHERKRKGSYTQPSSSQCPKRTK